MKKFTVFPVMLCLSLVLSSTCFAASTDVFSGDSSTDDSSISDNSSLADVAGSESDLLSSIKVNPSATDNYQAIANLYASENMSGYKVFVGGDLIDFTQYDNVQPVLINNRTLVPIRAISEALGAIVDWDNATSTITITQGPNVIYLTIDSATATVNGTQTSLDVPAELLGGRTMVPLRFVGSELGAQVGFYPSGTLGVIALYN
jgi:hypothetical protein